VLRRALRRCVTGFKLFLAIRESGQASLNSMVPRILQRITARLFLGCLQIHRGLFLHHSSGQNLDTQVGILASISATSIVTQQLTSAGHFLGKILSVHLFSRLSVLLFHVISICACGHVLRLVQGIACEATKRYGNASIRSPHIRPQSPRPHNMPD
jgi:hypothetical protein